MPEDAHVRFHRERKWSDCVGRETLIEFRSPGGGIALSFDLD